MGAIIALLKKDLYNLSSYKTSLIIILILVPIFCISISDIQFIIPALTMMLGMIAISTFSYDDMSKANKYINAMPCTKKEVVRGKYILAIMGIFLGGVIGTIVTIIVGNIINIINIQIWSRKIKDSYDYAYDTCRRDNCICRTINTCHIQHNKYTNTSKLIYSYYRNWFSLIGECYVYNIF